MAGVSTARVDRDRLEVAEQSIQRLLGRSSLKGLTFLDVGCGSGLFSIAASSLGASQVVGIDVNPRSIDASELNRARLASHHQIDFREMSVLDAAALYALGQFDVVYAWGSLHHTGAMWQAIENAASCTAQRGTLVLAIYNQHSTSSYWQVIKRYYSRLPRLGQEIVAVPFAAVIFFAKLWVTRKNPLDKERGMDFWFDVIDWLGGYPYEYAPQNKIQAFVNNLGFRMQRVILAQVPTGCNEYVFERCASSRERV